MAARNWRGGVPWSEPRVVETAHAHSLTAVQLILAWCIARGGPFVTATGDAKHMRDALQSDVLHNNLSAPELHLLNRFNDVVQSEDIDSLYGMQKNATEGHLLRMEASRKVHTSASRTPYLVQPNIVADGSLYAKLEADYPVARFVNKTQI